MPDEIFITPNFSGFTVYTGFMVYTWYLYIITIKLFVWKQKPLLEMNSIRKDNDITSLSIYFHHY